GRVLCAAEVPERVLPRTDRRFRRRPGSHQLHAENREVTKLLLPASVAFALCACGPPRRSLRSACPDLPLYQWEYDGSAKVWTRVHLEDDGGRPLTSDELSAIAQAEQHCITPPGKATTLTPNDAGISTPLDASSD